MDSIKIIGRINKTKNLYFCNYEPCLDNAINNFKTAKTVKVINKICYIHNISLGYFTEILAKEQIKFSVITTLN